VDYFLIVPFKTKSSFAVIAFRYTILAISGSGFSAAIKALVFS
jgi:hypothetical protein